MAMKTQASASHWPDSLTIPCTHERALRVLSVMAMSQQSRFGAIMSSVWSLLRMWCGGLTITSVIVKKLGP